MSDNTPSLEDARIAYAGGWAPDSVVGRQAYGEFDRMIEAVRAEERDKAKREPKVEIVREEGKPARCKVWRDGVLLFDGRDYSADLEDREPSDAERLSQDELAAISWCISYVATKGGFSQLSRRDAPPVKFAELNAKIGKMHERQEARRG